MADPTLLIVLGLPALILLTSVLLLVDHPDALPPSLRRLSRRPGVVWNVGVGLTIALAAIAALLRR
jgi:hypothetical protein